MMTKKPSSDALGTGPLTREKVRVRARALASIEGRSATEVRQTDYEQAKRELTGKSGLAQQEAMLDLLSETLSVEFTKQTSLKVHKEPDEDAPFQESVKLL